MAGLRARDLGLRSALGAHARGHRHRRPAGTPVAAAAAGIVSFSGWADGYGNYVCVTHAASPTTCHAHLSRIDARLHQTLAAGDLIGAVGCTGHCFGDHLHFETRLGSGPGAQPADPLPHLTALG